MFLMSFLVYPVDGATLANFTLFGPLAHFTRQLFFLFLIHSITFRVHTVFLHSFLHSVQFVPLPAFCDQVREPPVRLVRSSHSPRILFSPHIIDDFFFFYLRLCWIRGCSPVASFLATCTFVPHVCMTVFFFRSRCAFFYVRAFRSW